jgi:hypothetical protein
VAWSGCGNGSEGIGAWLIHDLVGERNSVMRESSASARSVAASSRAR